MLRYNLPFSLETTMRTKFGWVLGSVLVAALAFAGCSDDDDKGNDPQNTGGSGGDGGSGGSGGSGGGSPTEGACTNDSDKAAGRAGYCPGNKSVSAIVSECAINCLTADDENCTRDCVDEGTNSALSGECRDCYIELTQCGSANCVSVCLGNTGSEECVACLCGDNAKEVNCYAAFNECSGLGVTYCEDVANGTFEGYPPPDPPAQCDETDGGTDGGDDPDAGEDPDAGDEDPDAGDEEDAG